MSYSSITAALPLLSLIYFAASPHGNSNSNSPGSTFMYRNSVPPVGQIENPLHNPVISGKSWLTEYDYIVVGAGSAGSVIANRLSEDEEVTVLLLEAGGSENAISDIPLSYQNLQQTPMDWHFVTEPQKAACFGHKRKQSIWPRGKVLGGSSVLNAMLYVRGAHRDYDNWAANGAPGWSWREVRRYFLRSEDQQDPDYLQNGYHSRGGYLTVSSVPYLSPLGRAFRRVAAYLGYNVIDHNGPTITGFSTPQGTIRNGARCSTAKAFLRPARQRKNLHIVTFAHVTRVLFEPLEKRAIAVEFERFSMRQLVYVRREVILSAGTINTPQILMLSGIGPTEHLSMHGISTLHDLPGVGLNLQDHIYAGGVHFAVDSTHPPLTFSMEKTFTPSNVARYFTKGHGPLTSLGAVEGVGFVNTKFANVTDDWPDIQIHFSTATITTDGAKTLRLYQGVSERVIREVYSPYFMRDSFSIHPVLLRPKSRGWIRLRSRNPHDRVVIDPQYLTHPEDVHTLVEGMRIAYAIGQSPPLRTYGSTPFTTRFPGCEPYAYMSDEYLACVARTVTHTIYHPVGTCKMGAPADKLAVVDPQLRVYGIQNLRIADGSIMPTIVSGNTNAPIIMIGEKAADMIKKTWAERRAAFTAASSPLFSFY